LFVFRENSSEHVSNGRGRERERESQTDSALSTEADAGLDLMTLRLWPELKSRFGCLTDGATQAPPSLWFLSLAIFGHSSVVNLCYFLKIATNLKAVSQRCY